MIPASYSNCLYFNKRVANEDVKLWNNTAQKIKHIALHISMVVNTLRLEQLICKKYDEIITCMEHFPFGASSSLKLMF